MRFRRDFIQRRETALGNTITVGDSALGRNYVFVAVNHEDTTIMGHLPITDARRLYNTLTMIFQGRQR